MLAERAANNPPKIVFVKVGKLIIKEKGGKEEKRK
jgi:hypothetical protein